MVSGLAATFIFGDRIQARCAAYSFIVNVLFVVGCFLGKKITEPAPHKLSQYFE